MERQDSVRCSRKECGERFFADKEEDVFDEKFYCSYCIPFIEKCLCCGQHFYIKKGKRRSVWVRQRGRQAFVYSKAFLSRGICSECKEKYKSRFAGGFANGFLILRFLTFVRDEFKCRYCGRTPLTDKIKLHCDHIVARSKGGEDKIENLITACEECNSGKVDIMLEQSLITKLQERKVYESQ